jgi:hypothetical protein
MLLVTFIFIVKSLIFLLLTLSRDYVGAGATKSCSKNSFFLFSGYLEATSGFGSLK